MAVLVKPGIDLSCLASKIPNAICTSADGSGIRVPMRKDKKRPQRARDRGETILLTVEIAVDLDHAIEDFRQREMRTKKSIVVLAIQEYLAKHGAWPAKGRT